ncbi:MAG: MBL fold metallo-hydrolase [Sinimarinibacterium flocculans]|uniref:MBL fold metallo-hydrolase n=1 Tax=Sinimarinibacterium flocculans TaxID=985250 RepID=UPI003C61A3F7
MHRRRAIAGSVAVLVLLAAAAGAWLLWWRPAQDAQRLAALVRSEPPAADALTLTWFGVTAVLLRHGEDALMIDPFFSRPPGYGPLLRNAPIAPDPQRIAEGLRQAGIGQLHGVLVSHSHYDHAMDAGAVARRTGAMLVGSSSTLQIGRGAGLPEARLHDIAGGASLDLGPFTVRFIESRHAGATGGAPTGDIVTPLVPPARYLDYRQGGTYSILVTHPRGTVLHHGSAGFVTGALAGVHADTVVLGAALVEDAEAYVREVVDPVGAREVVLSHWDDFTRPLSAPLRPMPVVVNLAPLLEALSRRSGLRVRVPALAQPIAVTPPPPSTATAAPSGSRRSR